MSPARTTPKKKRPVLRRAIRKHTRVAYQEAILEAAAAVFGRLGFLDARMVDIAKEAGVSVGTLYNYFVSKDAVIDALHNHEMEELQAQLAQVSDTSEPCQRLRSLVETSFRFVQERGALVAMAMQSGLFDEEVAAQRGHGEHNDVQRTVLALYEKALMEAASAGKIRRDLDPVQMTIALDGMVSALIFSWVRTRPQKPLTDETDFVLSLFMKGASVK